MKRLTAVFLCLSLLFVFPAALAQEENVKESGEVRYVILSDNTAKIVGYTGENSAITFPSWVDGHTVTAIGDEVFDNYFWADSITIPETITSISSRAFLDSQANSIFVVPGNPVYESVGGVLYDKQKKMLHSYPDGRWSEKYSVRQGTKAIGEYAFCDSFALKAIELPEGLTDIGRYAFTFCMQLKDAALPQSLMTIGEGAFNECGQLKKVVIPENVRSIGQRAFSYCQTMDAFEVAQGNKTFKALDGVLFTMDGKVLLAYPGNRKGKEYAIPAETESISEEAFSGSTQLKSIFIPKGTRSIGGGAFGGGQALTEIKVEEGNPAYRAENGALFHAVLKRLEAYPAGKEDKKYAVPEGTLAIGDRVFENNLHLESVMLPGSVTTIGDEAFYACSLLTDISLPDGIRNIGAGTFAHCYSLKGITLPRDLTKIGEEAFMGSGLYDVALPESLEIVEKMAFGGCWQLMSVFIPGSRIRIDEEAFADCGELMLEVVEGSWGHAFANENKLSYTIQPVWLRK